MPHTSVSLRVVVRSPRVYDLEETAGMRSRDCYVVVLAR
jgi:hypothetical protein